MAELYQIAEQIAALDAEIAAGVEETIVDGTKVKVSLSVKQQERARLKRVLARMLGRGRGLVRPVDLGGF